jgi:Fe-S oxidoreductase
MSAPVVTTRPTPTEGCRYCWMCRQACPVGHVTARETYTPHGWALMIESVSRGQLSWTPDTAAVMYACADCGLCQAHCVTDQPLPHAIYLSRVALAAAGVAPAPVYEWDRRLRADGGAQGPVAPASSHTGAVGLFVGDGSPRDRPAELEAVHRLLQAAGLTPVLVSAGRSTGLSAATLGLRHTAVLLADAVLADVRAAGVSELLVFGPADRWTFSHVYPARLDRPWPEDVHVREVTDVLAEAHAAGRLRLRPEAIGPYAYHDPCHTARLGDGSNKTGSEAGSYRPLHPQNPDPLAHPVSRRAPRALLAAAFGREEARELFWREGRAHPCGAIGGLGITHPAIAAQLSDARLADAEAAGARWLFTDEPSCRHQLSGRSKAVTVRGLYEALADRL